MFRADNNFRRRKRGSCANREQGAGRTSLFQLLRVSWGAKKISVDASDVQG